MSAPPHGGAEWTSIQGDGQLHEQMAGWSGMDMQRPPPTHEVPLRQMQQLLGETWRYQQLSGGFDSLALEGGIAAQSAAGVEAQGGAALVASNHVPPVRFSRGGDQLCEPPPICSDLVEVRAMQGLGSAGLCDSQGEAKQGAYEPQGCDHRDVGGGHPPSSHASSGSAPSGTPAAVPASVERGSPPSSPEYLFLGRLVATLPADEAHMLGPSPPQAVVECNFWQRRQPSPQTRPAVLDGRGDADGGCLPMAVAGRIDAEQHFASTASGSSVLGRDPAAALDPGVIVLQKNIEEQGLGHSQDRGGARDGSGLPQAFAGNMDNWRNCAPSAPGGSALECENGLAFHQRAPVFESQHEHAPASVDMNCDATPTWLGGCLASHQHELQAKSRSDATCAPVDGRMFSCLSTSLAATKAEHMGFNRGTVGAEAFRAEESDEDLPPWPHEM